MYSLILFKECDNILYSPHTIIYNLYGAHADLNSKQKEGCVSKSKEHCNFKEQLQHIQRGRELQAELQSNVDLML